MKCDQIIATAIQSYCAGTSVLMTPRQVEELAKWINAHLAQSGKLVDIRLSREHGCVRVEVWWPSST